MVSFCLQLLVWHTAITMATAENPIKAPTLLMLKFSQGRFWDAMPCISDILWSPTCKSRCRSVAPSVNPDKPLVGSAGAIRILSGPITLTSKPGAQPWWREPRRCPPHHLERMRGTANTNHWEMWIRCLLLVVVVEAIQLGVNKKWNAQKLFQQRCRNWIQWDGAGDWIPTCGIHHNLWGSIRTYTMNIRAISCQTFEKKIENIQTAFPSLFHMKSIY
jgi:hypothetical protein